METRNFRAIDTEEKKLRFVLGFKAPPIQLSNPQCHILERLEYQCQIVLGGKTWCVAFGMIRKPILLFQQNELGGEHFDNLGTIEKVATVVDLSREWPMSHRLRHIFQKAIPCNCQIFHAVDLE
jgi:hypothetical protein